MLSKSASPAGQVRWNLDDQRCGRGEIHPIAPADAAGVALAAIQGLNQKVEGEVTALRAENAELKQRLEKPEQLMNRQNGGAR